MKKQFTIAVIDAQGGGLGKQLVSGVRRLLAESGSTAVRLVAVGTNAVASAAMLKAGADAAATGENPVTVICRDADVIIGPLGIVMADSMLGEITPAMAMAVARSGARRILIPFSSCDTYIAGVADTGLTRLVAAALEHVRLLLTENV